MARRDRTTGLPRRREQRTQQRAAGFLGIQWTEARQRLAILGGVGLIGLLVLGLIGYRWYDENIRMPGATVLTVADESFDLDYFTNRLGPFAQENPSLRAGFLEFALIDKLEREALTVLLAEERGIEFTEATVTQSIADDLGVPVGGSGSSFDTLYRQQLRTTGLSDDDYRRLSKASAADATLLDLFDQEVGETGETVTLRVILVQDREAAEGLLERINAGEDFGTLAQTESLDLTSRQQDGMLQPTPRVLFPEAVQTAIEGQPEGTLVGPIEVGSNVWIARVETINPEGTYTDGERQQLAKLKIDEALVEIRTRTVIQRDLSPREIEWAYDHVNASAGSTGN
jgi:hypothetical protein